MTATYIPPGFAREVPERDRRVRTLQATLDELKRLPGALGWSFECFQNGLAITLGDPIGGAGGIPPTTNFLVGPGFEGVIDWVASRNQPAQNLQAQWNGAITLNGVPIPGLEFFGQLKATGNASEWWTECEEYVPENSLVEMRLVNFAAGAAWMVGGRVHGWQWPIQARLDWEAAHPER